MSDSFGARLRQHREARHVELTTIADETKIKLSLFEQLERDDLSHWPSGIFRRAYVRAYAHAIGLDPDVVLRDFLQVHPDPIEAVEPVAVLTGANATPPTRLRTIVGAAIGSFSRRPRSSAPALEAVPAAPAESAETCGTSGQSAALSMRELPAVEPDFTAVAHLCTKLGQVATGSELPSLLQEAARVLDATGLVVWLWDPAAGELRPAAAHGYSDKVLAQLPGVRRDADNATAAAFRLAEACTIAGNGQTSGALVVPLLTAAGCSGVLALELEHGTEQQEAVRAVAAILAALLAQLTGGASADQPVNAETTSSPWSAPAPASSQAAG